MPARILKTSPAWRNRIVRHADVDPRTLTEHPSQWRLHPASQQDALAGVIHEVGYVQPVLVSEATGHILDGHLRVGLAIREAQASVPVTYVQVSAEEERLILSTIDPLAAMAESNRAQLAGLLAEVQSGEAAVQQMLTGLAEREGIVTLNGSNGEAGTDVEPQSDRAAELREQWGVEVGQLWSLGEHRVICGDCTGKAVVERLMQGEEAAIVLADPPYGMHLDTDFHKMRDWRKQQHGGKHQFFNAQPEVAHAYTPVVHDDRPFDPTSIFTFWGDCQEIFLWGADYYAERIPARDKGSWLVWDKRLDETFDRMFGSGFELCWSKQRHKREIIRVRWISFLGVKTDDVKHRVHPTQKPLDVNRWILERYSSAEALVVDPYLGSGSTLIACQTMGRRCYGCEIDPGYVAVTLQRYADLTNQQPVLVS